MTVANDFEEMLAGLAYSLDSRTGVRNRWADVPLSEVAKALHVRNGRSAETTSVTDAMLWRDRPREAPVVRGAMTTSDFPNLLSGAIALTVSTLYALPTTMRTVAARRELPGFQQGSAVRIGRAPLTEVFEGGEVHSEVLLERAETAKLKTFANLVNIGRMLLVNDDKQAISDAVHAGIDSALQIEDTLIFGLLSANNFGGVTMSDGATLFHAGHANTSVGVISAASLAAGYEALLDQRDVGGQVADTSPRYILVGPKTVVTARVELAKLGIPIPLTVLVEPRLADRADWYLVADPARCAALELGSLRGAAPVVQLGQQATVDGISIRIRHDCGAWAQDFRPIWRSAGV